MPSPTYELIAQAMTERKQVLCVYEGFAREVCPIILGHKNGREKTLAFQFAGASSKNLPPGRRLEVSGACKDERCHTACRPLVFRQQPHRGATLRR